MQCLAWVRPFMRNCVTVCRLKWALALDLFFGWSWESKPNFLKVQCSSHCRSAHSHAHRPCSSKLFIVSCSEHMKCLALGRLSQYLMDWIFSFRCCLLLFQSKAEDKRPFLWALLTISFLRPPFYFRFIKILVFPQRVFLITTKNKEVFFSTNLLQMPSYITTTKKTGYFQKCQTQEFQSISHSFANL